jgi:uncharacterized metal-binding protein YceD (DUF177 family)
MKSILIPLNDWAAGERKFHSHAGLEFFQQFDNTEILDADVDVDIRVVKDGRNKIEADLYLKGSVTVPCDRCLDPVRIPVETAPSETLTPGAGDVEWDLSQAVYDFVCLSLPLQRLHPEGECDPNTVRFLSHKEQGNEEAEATGANSPFAALKGLFDSK